MTLAVVTPSYRSDFTLFSDLHRSVLRYTSESVKHYVIVPTSDIGLFSSLAGPRCVVISEESLYPRRYRPARVVNRVLRYLPGIPAHARIAAINVRHPLHPVRGWVMQQALKLEMSRRLDADKVLLVDSDVELVRPINETNLGRGVGARLYRIAGEVDEHLPQHMEWHAVSRELLGLAPPRFPASDYVTSFCVWEPEVVRGLLMRIEHVTGRMWMDAVTRRQTFSEWTLYGVYAEHVMNLDGTALTEASLCHSYWDTVPLTAEGAAEFTSGIAPDDVAILIQSKSKTPRAVRRTALDSFDFAMDRVSEPSEKGVR